MPRRSILAAVPLAFAGERRGSLEQVDLFSAGEGGVHTYRIPALVQTRKGALLAIADARHDNASDLPGRLSLVMRRSSDGGRTWSPARTLYKPASGGAGDASLLLEPGTGRVWCFFAYGPPGIGFPTAKPGAVTGAETLQFHAMHSDDGGESWSAPVDLTPQVKDPAWQALFATSGTHFATRAGRFLVPLVVRERRDGPTTSRNAYSDDRGKTWRVGSAIGPGTDESKAVELSDGSVLQNMRVAGGKVRAIAISRDGGVTFDAVSPETALPDPSCNGGIAVLRKGVLVFTNAASPSRRENLTVRLSYDNGRTWPYARTLHAGPAAYSTIIPLNHGRGIGVLYECGNSSPIERITFARFSEDWMKEGRRQ
jgi:sialidase-1